MKLMSYLLLALAFLAGSVLLYFTSLIYLSAQTWQALHNRDIKIAAEYAGILIKLTQWTDSIHTDKIFLISLCHVVNTTATLINSSYQLEQSSETAIQAVFAGSNTQSWHKVQQNIDQAFSDLSVWRTDFQHLSFIFKLFGKEKTWQDIDIATQDILSRQDLIESLIILTPKIFGADGMKTYTFILQNDKELRPTGGFMGSYAQLSFSKGKLLRQIVQDIYVPDGAIPGHVNPPKPIQEAFKQGWWRLRDSNWDPDFTKATETITWFMEKGNTPVGDGIIAVNLSVIEDIMDVFGEITLPDYGKKITPDNLYATAQYEAERQFFPGSTQKRDFLQALTKQLLFRSESLEVQDWLKIIQIVEQHLGQRNIQMHFNDPKLQKIAQQMNWSGALTWSKDAGCNNDYHLWIEANLGANKANCCIKRTLSQTVVDNGEEYEITVTGVITNENIYSNPRPPKFWGGDYQNYVRVFLPQTAKNVEIAVNQEIIDDQNLIQAKRIEIPVQEIGFWAKVKAKKTATITVRYILPKENVNLPYCLYVAKQSGVPGYDLTIEYQSTETQQQSRRFITTDQLIRFD